MNSYKNRIGTDSSAFHFEKTNRCLVGDMSDLQLDKVPTYIEVKSVRTGKVVTFMAYTQSVDREGDLYFTDYRPCGTQAGGAWLRLYND